MVLGVAVRRLSRVGGNGNVAEDENEWGGCIAPGPAHTPQRGMVEAIEIAGSASHRQNWRELREECNWENPSLSQVANAAANPPGLRGRVPPKNQESAARSEIRRFQEEPVAANRSPKNREAVCSLIRTPCKPGAQTPARL